jgi:hypothetical protein
LEPAPGSAISSATITAWAPLRSDSQRRWSSRLRGTRSNVTTDVMTSML